MNEPNHIDIERLKIPLGELPLPELKIESDQLSLQEVVAHLQNQKMGSVVLGNNQKITGIITERDFIFRIVGKIDNWEEACVGEVMTKNPFILEAKQTLLEAAKMMSNKKIRHLPVFDKETNKYSMISIKDILKYISDFFSSKLCALGNVVEWDYVFVSDLGEDFSTISEDRKKINAGIFFTPLKRVIFNKPVIVEPHCSILEALERMRSQGRNSVLICEHGTLLKGIVTERDFLFKVFGKVDINKGSTPISDFMTKAPHTLLVKHFIGHALNNMFKFKYRNTIVVNEDHYPVSIIGLIEIFSFFMSRIDLD